MNKLKKMNKYCVAMAYWRWDIFWLAEWRINKQNKIVSAKFGGMEGIWDDF